MKKRSLFFISIVFLCLILCSCAVSLTGTDLPCEDFLQSTSSLRTESYSYQKEPSMAAGQDSGLTSLSQITNFVIFICFSDDNISEVQSAIVQNEIVDVFNGQTNSLKDYYQKLSYSKLTINTVFPLNGDGSFFVYRSPNPRSHYLNITSNNSEYRRTQESALLNSAVQAADSRFDYLGAVLDGNNDGFIDSVSFIISGEPSKWGHLLWAHAWSLDYISKNSEPKVNAAMLGGKQVNEFTFNFVKQVDSGFACHEMGHVLGMPDLYYYDENTSALPVGDWDLMHYNSNPPQYTTTYMRYKYLNFASEEQIHTVTTNGEYSLTPTSTAKSTEILAYKIYLNSKESIWIEYRNNQVSEYDSALPGSGLIVYRVNNSVTGNENAKPKNKNKPEELFIYRPHFGTSEKNRLNAAFVSTSNASFPKIGVANSTVNYHGTTNNSAIYLSNGENTKIVITPTAQTDESITFTINLGDYNTNTIEELVVLDNPYEMFIGSIPEPRVQAKYKDSGSYQQVLQSRLSYTYDATKIGEQIATVVYIDANNIATSATFRLIINDSIDINGCEIDAYPHKTTYELNEDIDLSGLKIKIKWQSGNTEYISFNNTDMEEWQVEGVDKTKSGDYDAEVWYLPLNIKVSFHITILSDLVGIEILQKDSVIVFRQNIKHSEVKQNLSVVGIYSDGSKRKITTYTINEYNNDLFWVAQTLEVTQQSFSDTIEIFIVPNNAKVQRIDLDKKNKSTQYNYGERLNLDGMELRFEYESGESITVPLNSYYAQFNGVYNAINSVTQSLSAQIEGIVCTITVTVKSTSTDTISIDNSYKNFITISGSNIFIEKAYTLQDIQNVFRLRSDLQIVFYNKDGKEININSYPNLKLGTGVKLAINNGEKNILSYTFVLLGDANGDGVLDSSDIEQMIYYLKIGKKNVYNLDKNGDGSFTLTDFVLWVEILEKK